MYSFTNDYSEGAHPRILQAMLEANLVQNTGYILDTHTNHAIQLIRDEIQSPNAQIHMISGGTQTNLITIAAALRPYQAVISASTDISMSMKLVRLRLLDIRFLPCRLPMEN